MGTIKHLSAEWERWIVLNIDRKVPAAALVEEMVKKNFELAFAMTSVAQRMPAAALSNSGAARQSAVHSWGNRLVIAGHTIEVVTRVNAPQLMVLDSVLTDAECDELIAASQPKLKPSTIVDGATGAEQVIAARSSEGAFFLRGENALVTRIEERLAAITGMPMENGEGLQILHYGVGGEYQPHFDFFAPEEAGSALHLERGGQRVSTLIMYLNDVAGGGETIFPDIELEVAPRKGGGVYFSYCDEHGILDRRTLHGGAPVKQGEKWIATHWLRQAEYR
ncbi:MAG TPA: 2OG-Fe(II) oxygenase [Steroidobacteraceae bacterium]|jgi:prolyl 4-hydroxylase|nr:2OG-Fe(II) oxygenase [Steroidobacteraceae bacterium]